jgi:hypothetical protein
VTFESGLSKGVNVLAIFKYVVEIEVFWRGGRQEKVFLLPGLFFERLTFLSKIENRLKGRKILCENFTRRSVFEFSKNI